MESHRTLERGDGIAGPTGAHLLRARLLLAPRSLSSPVDNRGSVPLDMAASASPLQCALTKNAPASPLQCALAKSKDLNPPGINTYKKPGASPLFFSLLPASLLPWLMAGTRLSPMAPAPHASMNDRPSLSYQRRQQPQPETTAKLSPRNSPRLGRAFSRCCSTVAKSCN